jgi:hypothetical protein
LAQRFRVADFNHVGGAFAGFDFRLDRQVGDPFVELGKLQRAL